MQKEKFFFISPYVTEFVFVTPFIFIKQIKFVIESLSKSQTSINSIKNL